MSERQEEINNEVLYFIATGEGTPRHEIDKTFGEYTSEEVDTALTSLALIGCIDCQGELILATPLGQTSVEKYKKSLPKTVTS